MSTGNRVRTLRVYPLLAAAIDATIARRNTYRPRRPWTWSEFMVIAAWEKCAKMERSRRQRPRTKKTLENKDEK